MKPRRTLLSTSHAWRMDRDTAAIIAVSRTLRQLLNAPQPFHLVSSLLRGHGDVHHLAVGSSGVFAIATSSHDGVVRFEPHRRAVRTHATLDDALRLARRGAAVVRERLRGRGVDLRVQPILCLPFADLDRPQYVDAVIVTRREHLDYLIRHWPGQPLTEAQAARVFSALQARIHRAAA